MHRIITEVQNVTLYDRTDGHLHRYNTAETDSHRTACTAQDFDFFSEFLKLFLDDSPQVCMHAWTPYARQIRDLSESSR